MNLTLKPVSGKDYKFLYKLLSQRSPDTCISHRQMPSYKEHCRFNETLPYNEDYIIYFGRKRIGRVYITKLREVGIHFLKEYGEQMYREVFKYCKDKIRYANVAPQNKKVIEILKKGGFRLIQHTYEKDIS